MPPARFPRHFTSTLLKRSLLWTFFLFCTLDYLSVGKSISDLSDLDLYLLSYFALGNEDNESFDLRYSVPTSANFSNADVVFLAYFDRFGSEGPRPAETATSIAASTSVTRILSTPCV